MPLKSNNDVFITCAVDHQKRSPIVRSGNGCRITRSKALSWVNRTH